MLHKSFTNEKIQSLVPLSNFTTWKIGGPAEWIGEPKGLNELLSLISWANKKRIPCQIIGAGSNILISDKGIKGLTICMRKMHGLTICKQTGLIEANCGEAIPNLARKAAKDGLHGLQWSVGIPGTVGGAITMNAGAQNGCIADRLISVKVLSLEESKTFELKKKELNFSYRQSLLQQEKLIVLSARFHLEPGHNPEQLIHETNQNLNHRLKTQPYHLPSCGSVFRNPKDLKVGQIIQELGLKGLREGNAEISSIHGNFIVNQGGATAKDISRLISIIQEKVQEKYGVLLQTEVKRLGFQSTN